MFNKKCNCNRHPLLVEAASVIASQKQSKLATSSVDDLTASLGDMNLTLNDVFDDDEDDVFDENSSFLPSRATKSKGNSRLENNGPFPKCKANGTVFEIVNRTPSVFELLQVTQ